MIAEGEIGVTNKCLKVLANIAAKLASRAQNESRTRQISVLQFVGGLTTLTFCRTKEEASNF